MRCGDQEVGVGEAGRGRFGRGDIRLAHAELLEELAVQRPLDGERAQGRAHELVHGGKLWRPGPGNRQRAGILVEIELVLGDVELEPIPRQRPRRQLAIERQVVDRLAQARGPLPDVLRECHSLILKSCCPIKPSEHIVRCRRLSTRSPQ